MGIIAMTKRTERPVEAPPPPGVPIAGAADPPENVGPGPGRPHQGVVDRSHTDHLRDQLPCQTAPPLGDDVRGLPAGVPESGREPHRRRYRRSEARRIFAAGLLRPGVEVGALPGTKPASARGLHDGRRGGGVAAGWWRAFGRGGACGLVGEEGHGAESRVPQGLHGERRWRLAPGAVLGSVVVRSTAGVGFTRRAAHSEGGLVRRDLGTAGGLKSGRVFGRSHRCLPG
mmetsp:Transcript_17041/g.37512  ORF Transcript_17041/g.37512 Transcript_17041/m.37512 type:complete len:229 (+) Transcript_17041:193-879(+)